MNTSKLLPPVITPSQRIELQGAIEDFYRGVDILTKRATRQQTNGGSSFEEDKADQAVPGEEVFNQDGWERGYLDFWYEKVKDLKKPLTGGSDVEGSKRRHMQSERQFRKRRRSTSTSPFVKREQANASRDNRNHRESPGADQLLRRRSGDSRERFSRRSRNRRSRSASSRSSSSSSRRSSSSSSGTGSSRSRSKSFSRSLSRSPNRGRRRGSANSRHDHRISPHDSRRSSYGSYGRDSFGQDRGSFVDDDNHPRSMNNPGLYSVMGRKKWLRTNQVW
ncbi:hypothetical protein BC832DRAFT_139091 [Gaertneriomyces semiglobifer]|nr:hypothetical protein BC832DRAFT_139091 [Gaertneriomyces semiglobifer]